MTDAPRAQGEGNAEAGTKPSIAEVAAWLRRAAEQRDSIEDLRPAPRPTAAPPPSGPTDRDGHRGPSGPAEQEDQGPTDGEDPNPTGPADREEQDATAGVEGEPADRLVAPPPGSAVEVGGTPGEGLVDVTNKVGGVNVCLKTAVHDQNLAEWIVDPKNAITRPSCFTRASVSKT